MNARNVVVRTIARADPNTVDGLAAFGTATVHEAIGRRGFPGPQLRPIQQGTRLAGTAVTANCLHPGAVATALFRRLPRFLEMLIKLVTLSPERGARTSVYLASSGEVAAVTGKYFVRSREAPVSREASDDKLGETLWQISEGLTGNDDNRGDSER